MALIADCMNNNPEKRPSAADAAARLAAMQPPSRRSNSRTLSAEGSEQGSGPRFGGFAPADVHGSSSRPSEAGGAASAHLPLDNGVPPLHVAFEFSRLGKLHMSQALLVRVMDVS